MPEGLRLIVTRPEPEATRTAEWLSGAGHLPLLQPMLHIVFAAPPVVEGEPAALVATSRNGVRALAAWPFAARWRGKPLFVTGEGTAAEAALAGFTDIRAGSGDAVSLVAVITGDMPPGSGTFLHAAGRDRTPALAEGLRGAGYNLHVVEAYRAEAVAALDPAVADALRSGRADGVVLFSRRTAAAFVDAVRAAGLELALAGLTGFAISAHAAEPLRPFTRHIRVAPHPDFNGMAAIIPKVSGV